MTPKQQKKIVIDEISDMVLNLIVDDRRDDDDLPVGAIESLITDKHLTVDEMVEAFRSQLTKRIQK